MNMLTSVNYQYLDRYAKSLGIEARDQPFGIAVRLALSPTWCPFKYHRLCILWMS